jgi:hypothetical protein
LSFLGRHEGRKEGCQGRMYQGRKDVKKGRISRKEGCQERKGVYQSSSFHFSSIFPLFLLLSVASFFILTSLHFNFPSLLL